MTSHVGLPYKITSLRNRQQLFETFLFNSKFVTAAKNEFFVTVKIKTLRDPTSGVGRSIIGGGGGGGSNIHIFVFTDIKNNRFQKKLIMQNTNISILPPPPPSPIIDLPTRLMTLYSYSQ